MDIGTDEDGKSADDIASRTLEDEGMVVRFGITSVQLWGTKMSPDDKMDARKATPPHKTR